MKLENLLLFKNKGIYLVISFTVLFLIKNSWWYMIILPFYFLYLYKNHNMIIKIMLVILGLYLVRVIQFQENTIDTIAQSEVKVVKDIKIADYTTFTGRHNLQLVKVYTNDIIYVRPGDSLLCDLVFETPMENTTHNLFNYRNYLMSQNIKYIASGSNCKIVDSSWNINLISYKLNNYIDDNFQYSNEYIKTFILADKSEFDDEIIEGINIIGISHLFAVSGLHISLIVLTMMFTLKKAKIKELYIEVIIVLFLILYMIITSFSPSVTRASFMFIILIINKKFKIGLSSLDVLSLIFTVLLFIKPFYYYDTGFLLSFLVTFVILLSYNILNDETKLKQLLKLSFISFLVTIPIILKLNYQVNLLSVIFNIIFLFYITYIILPLGYITFFIPVLDKFYNVFIIVFEGILKISTEIDYFIVKVYFTSSLAVIVYYLLVFLTMHRMESHKSLKTPLILIGLTLLIMWGEPYYRVSQSVTFLDIYGDSTIIIDSFDECNIIIDTGEKDEYNTLVNYLKTKNIKRIDYLIITHNHSDHYGEAQDVLNEFDVISMVNRNNVSQYEGYNSCGNIDFYIYSNDIEYSNENNNSIILSLFLNDRHYLFTGDIELSREKDFIKEVKIDVDYLKVPHHGSITSSSYEFVQHVKPEEVFIIVSRNNRNKHPSDIVVSRYENLGIKVYRTDLNGTIVIKYLFGKEFKKVNIE